MRIRKILCIIILISPQSVNVLETGGRFLAMFKVFVQMCAIFFIVYTLWKSVNEISFKDFHCPL